MTNIADLLFAALTKNASPPQNPKIPAHEEYVLLASKIAKVAESAASSSMDTKAVLLKEMSLELLSASIGMVQMVSVIEQVNKIERENA